jgi:hypothetical protein
MVKKYNKNIYFMELELWILHKLHLINKLHLILIIQLIIIIWVEQHILQKKQNIRINIDIKWVEIVGLCCYVWCLLVIVRNVRNYMLIIVILNLKINKKLLDIKVWLNFMMDRKYILFIRIIERILCIE